MFEVVNEKYTKGIWKKIVASKMRKLGTTAGSSYDFSIRDATDVEAFRLNIKRLLSYRLELSPDRIVLLNNFSLFHKNKVTKMMSCVIITPAT